MSFFSVQKLRTLQRSNESTPIASSVQTVNLNVVVDTQVVESALIDFTSSLTTFTPGLSVLNPVLPIQPYSLLVAPRAQLSALGEYGQWNFTRYVISGQRKNGALFPVMDTVGLAFGVLWDLNTDTQCFAPNHSTSAMLSDPSSPIGYSTSLPLSYAQADSLVENTLASADSFWSDQWNNAQSRLRSFVIKRSCVVDFSIFLEWDMIYRRSDTLTLEAGMLLFSEISPGVLRSVLCPVASVLNPQPLNDPPSGRQATDVPVLLQDKRKFVVRLAAQPAGPVSHSVFYTGSPSSVCYVVPYLIERTPASTPDTIDTNFQSNLVAFRQYGDESFRYGIRAIPI